MSEGTWLRIVSDGTPRNTRVETEDGTLVRGVQGISWNLQAGDFARISLDVLKVPVDVVGLVEEEESSIPTDPTAIVQTHIEDAAPEGPGFPTRCPECGLPPAHHAPDCPHA